MLRRVNVAAVEDRAVQVMWGHAPAGEVTVTARGGPSVSIAHGGGPGGAVLGGLEPTTTYELTVRAGGLQRRLAATTLASPPGAELCRVATISDTHIGSRVHGLLKTMVDRSDHADPAPVRCARAAVAEAAAWGAQLLVGKGDLTQHGWRQEWHALGALLRDHGAGMAMIAVAGNHDFTPHRDIDPHEGLALAGLGQNRCHTAGPASCPVRGVTTEPGLQVVDVPGLRVIALDSAHDSHHVGSVRHRRAEVLQAAAEAATPVLVCAHHPLELWPLPTKYPIGVRWPESARFSRDLARANPRAIVVAGHSHRNRRSDRAGIVHAEVGSTKDWPGVWGGYAVHEGGIRQVVRRIMAPDALGWIDYSRWAVGGVWRFYAPGQLAARCFVHTWPS